MNLEKSISFTREKKLKTQSVFVNINLLNAVSVPVVYISCIGKRMTEHISSHLLQNVTSTNLIPYFGSRSLEQKISLVTVLRMTEICHRLKFVVSCAQNAKTTCQIFQSKVFFLLQSLDIEPVHSVTLYNTGLEKTWWQITFEKATQTPQVLLTLSESRRQFHSNSKTPAISITNNHDANCDNYCGTSLLQC